MKRLTLLAVLAVGVLAPSAAAKQITRATVCGPHGCVTTTARSTLRGFEDGGLAEAAPTRRARFYSLRMTLSEPGTKFRAHWRLAWVPSVNLIRTNGDGAHRFMWTDASPAATRWLRHVTARLSAFPPQRLELGRTSAAAPRGVEVVNPPPAGPAMVTTGGAPWLLIGISAAALGGAALLLARRRRRLESVLSGP